MTDKNSIKVLFVSAEVAPFAKTGGLADVAGSLPKELALMGADVRVVMPRYKQIKSEMEYVTDFAVQIGDKKETCIVRKERIHQESEGGAISVPVYFIDSYNYYDRPGIYCYFDDAERFAFLCKAVLEMLPRINFKPDIIHCNDWHTGPICMLLNEVYKNDIFYKNIATIYTIHNLEYQGNFPGDVLRLFNVGSEIFNPEKVEFYGMFSFMKAGLVYADIINTVSVEYSKEIQTERYGEKMEGILQKRSKDLFGIINGISYKAFDPEKDPRIYRNYNSQSYKLKKENKYALQREFGLPVRDVPVIGIVSRLSEQKGLELILDKFEDLMKQDVQFVLLGTGDEHYETSFKNAKLAYPEKVGVYIGFNTDLAQRIYAGCDMFLMPSRFEPCGLGQIISLRYGTIPIVRATGGLADTIVDYNADSANGNGFVFNEFSSDEMFDAIMRALKLYNESPDIWASLVKRALTLDFSWSRSAKKYIELYEKAMKKKS